jgi:hypothetical protein
VIQDLPAQRDMGAESAEPGAEVVEWGQRREMHEMRSARAVGRAEPRDWRACALQGQEGLCAEAFQPLGRGRTPDLYHRCVWQQVIYVPVGFLALAQMAGQSGFQTARAHGAAAVAVET